VIEVICEASLLLPNLNWGGILACWTGGQGGPTRGPTRELGGVIKKH